MKSSTQNRRKKRLIAACAVFSGVSLALWLQQSRKHSTSSLVQPIGQVSSFVPMSDARSAETAAVTASEASDEENNDFGAWASAPVVAPDFAKIDAFQDWLTRWERADATEREALIEEGKLLASERRLEFKRLIISDPKLALELSVARVIRQDLPDEIVQLLEKPVSATGNYDVLMARPAPGDTKPAELVLRYFEAEGMSYIARVYGEMTPVMSRKNIPLRGVAIDREFGVAESPVRALELGERITPGTEVESVCPVSGEETKALSSGEPVKAETPVIEVGERVIALCNGSHVEVMDEKYKTLIQAAGPGGAAFFMDTYPGTSSRAIGNLRCLYIRGTYPDRLEQLNTEDQAAADMANTARFFSETSFGKCSLTTTITPMVVLPHTFTWYTTKDTEVNGLGLLQTHARIEARRLGYDSTQYDCIILRINGLRSGASWGGGDSVWLGWGGMDVINHEVGHSLGLNHANFWQTSDGTAYGHGANQEYGNPFDVMGGGGGFGVHYNTVSKRQVGWLPNNYVHFPRENGVYRVHAYDQPRLEENKRYGLTVAKDSIRSYNIEYHPQGGSTLRDNALVIYSGMGSNAGHLLDTTPGSSGGKNDGGIQVGRTFSDEEADLHFTVLSRQDTSPPSLDIAFMRGPFPGNVAPTCTLTASATTLALGQTVTLTADASDANGDDLSYYWQFDDGTTAANSAVITRSFSTATQVTAMLTVSDMKGGTVRRHVVLSVGTHGRQTVSGVVTFQGQPLPNVRVATGSKFCFTAQDGSYALAGLNTGSQTFTATLNGYTLTPQFINPLTVVSGGNTADWTAETNIPFVTLVKNSDATENGLGGSFTLSRTGDATASLTVRVSPQGGTATKGTDYNFSPDFVADGSYRTFTIPAGQSSLTVSVPTINDTSAEGPETITLQLASNGTYLSGAANAIVMNIADDDTTLPQVALRQTDPYALENPADVGTLVLTRTGSTAAALTVVLTWTGTATNGADYASLPTSAVIPAGQSSVNLVVTPLNDTVIEGPEDAIATIATNAAYVRNSAGTTATVTITDDDTPVVSLTLLDGNASEAGPDSGVFLVTRTGSTAAPLKVFYGMSGTAYHGTDYAALSGELTIPAGQSSAPIVITPYADDLGEGTEMATISLTTFNNTYSMAEDHRFSVTIDDGGDVPLVSVRTGTVGVEGGANATVVFRSLGSSTGSVTVNYTVSGTATSGVDYTALSGTVTLPAAGPSDVTLTIPVINDVSPESTESVFVRITPSTAYRVYNDGSATAFIRDNDSGDRVMVSTYQNAPAEGGGTGRFYLHRAGATTADMTVNYSLSGTATSGVDFTGLSGTAVILAGQPGVDVPFTVVDDALAEGTETLTLQVEPGVGYGLDIPSSATFEIGDNEVLPVSVGFSAATSTTTEQPTALGEYRDIPVTLSTAATSTVTVRYASGGGVATGDDVDWAFVDAAAENAIIPQGTLVFDPGVTTRFIRIRVKNDGVAEPIESLSIELRSPFGASLASGLNRHTMMVGDTSVSGLVLEERWSGSTAYTNQSWSSSTPAVSNFLTSFTPSQNVAENYSRRITGQIVAPVTGAYRFWIASDDDSRLFLSTTSSPANRVQIASLTGWVNYQSWDSNASQRSALINLVAGESYYMEVQHLEGGGGDHVSVAWEGPGITRQAIPAQTPENLATRYVRLVRTASTRRESDGSDPELMAILDRPAGITPVSVNYSVSGTATRGVDYTLPDGPLVFAPGEQMKSIPLALLTDSMAESPESIVLTLGDAAGVQASAPLSHVITLLDDNAPVVNSQILTARSNMAAGTVLGTATSNVAEGRSVVSWSIVAGNEGGLFSVASNGAISLINPAGLPNPGSRGLLLRATDSLGASGDGLISIDCNPPTVLGVREQRWSGATAYNNQNWTGTTNFNGVLSTYTTAQNVADNYSRRLTGYLRPTVTGNYTFWIASDDASRLFLSTTASEANKIQIASVSGFTNFQIWDSNASQKSVIIPLVAGQIYWLEVQHLEGAGGDHVSVAWSGPGISREAIPASAVYVPGSPAATPVPAMVALTSPLSGASFVSGEAISLAADVIAGSETVQSVEFYRGSTLIAADTTAPYAASWISAPVGIHALSAVVKTTGGAVSSTPVMVEVTSGNLAPQFNSNPVSAGAATVGTPYVGTLAGTATDANAGDVLTFSKVSGPAWLSVAADGALSGTPAVGDVGLNEFTVRVTDSQAAFADATLQISVLPQQATWIQSAGGSWNTSSHWLGGLIASGVGTTARFDTIDLTAASTVTLDGSKTIGHLVFGDTSPSHNWTLATGSGGELILDVPTGQPSITVNNQTTTISASLAGNKGLVKSGTGTLALTGSNVYTGGTLVNQGTLSIGSASSLGAGALAMTNVGTSFVITGTAVTLSQDILLPSSGSGNVSLVTPNNSSTILNGVISGGAVGTVWFFQGGTAGNNTGALTLNGNNTLQGTINVQRGPLILGHPNAAGSAVILLDSNSPPTGALQFSGNTTLTNPLQMVGGASIGVASGQSVALSGAITGSAGLIKVGAGELVLTNAKTYSGTTSVNSGTLTVQNASGSATGTSGVAVAAGATLAGSGAISGSVSVSGTLAAGGNTVGQLSTGALTLNASPTIVWNVADWAGTAGVTSDLVLTPNLQLAGLTQATIVLQAPNLTNFTNASKAFPLIRTTSGITGFSASQFVVDASTLPQVTGVWSVVVMGDDLVLLYTRSNAVPAFTGDPFVAASALEDQAYLTNLAAAVNDPDLGEVLIFEKLSGPGWLTVQANGTASGMPSNADVGWNEWTVRVTDSFAASATTTLRILVTNVNDAPVFTSNPIDAGPVAQGQSIVGNLSGFVQDPDAGDLLTFTKISGPNWLTVAANGLLLGTPGNADVGSNNFVVRISDAAGAWAESSLVVQVSNVNDAPVFLVNPIAGGSVKALASYSGGLLGSASDIDVGDIITYSKVSGPAWLLVASSGAMSGSPAESNVGTNQFVVRVSDTAGAFTDATLTINVTPPNVAPNFLSNPITGASAVSGNAYGASLAGTAVDANAGDTISYSKVSGPAWLTVAADGSLSGTPGTTNLGANSFIVRATDGDGANSQATLNIQVSSLPLPWLAGKIGTVNLAGSSSFLSGSYTLSGSGVLTGNADGGYFVYQTLSGDGEIIARIDQMQNTGTSSRVGVMIRNTLASNAQYTAMTATGTGAYRWSRRTAAGAKSTVSNHGNGTLPNVWVRVTRVGNTFTSFTSANGTTWTSVGSVTMTLNTNCFVGLYVASGSNTTLNTSRFVNVSVTP